MIEQQTRRFGLVLGGGGVRCLSHLGLASVLENAGIRPDLIATSSTGSLIGLFIASGIPVRKVHAALFDPKQRLRWLRFSFRRGGLFSPQALIDLMDHFKVPDRLEDLVIPLHVVVTDLVTGDMRVFDRGSSREIVLASAALPGIYAPVDTEGSLMGDGGITNNVPADICRKLVGPDGFVLSSSLEMNPGTPRELLGRIPQVMYRAIYLPLIHSRTRCVISHSDLVIQPFSDQPLCFSRWREIVRFWSVATMADLYEIGRTHMERHLPELKAQLARPECKERKTQ